MRLSCIILLFTLLPGSIERELETALKELDNTILIKDKISTVKEMRIDSLRRELSTVADPPSRYRLSGLLYEQYRQWNPDSALYYAHSKEVLAARMESRHHQNEAFLDLADCYRISGMYTHSLDALESVDTTAIATQEMKARYYHIYFETYYGLARTVKDSLFIRGYKQMERDYLYRLGRTIQKGDPAWCSTMARIGILEGRIPEMREMLLQRLSEEGISMEEENALHARLLKIYQVEGDETRSLIHCAQCAKLDFELGKKEYGALIKLAQELYQIGDLERAYHYITTSYNDAIDADVHVSLNSIGRSLPVITSAYEHQNAKRTVIIITIAILLFVLLIALLALYLTLNRSWSQLHKAKIKIEEQAQQVKESNKIMEACMGEFLSQFSEHTNSLERYQSRLRVTAKQMDFNAILQELRSYDFIEEESKHFYQQFDLFFLKLFPNFVDQVNALLQPDKQISKRLPKGRLSNELRILALIRLGVTDSARIAKFLKRSPSTIYNLRVLLRNAALNDRDNFEQRIKVLEINPGGEC